MIKQQLLSLCTLVFLVLSAPGLTSDSDSELLRSYLEQALSSGHSPVSDINTIISIYNNNHGQPLWFRAGPLSSQRKALMTEIETSSRHGFQPSNYHLEQLQDASLSEEIRDILMSDALLLQIQHRATGVVDRKNIDPEQGNWFIEHVQHTPEFIFQSILQEPETLTQMLQSIWPRHPDYAALLNKRAELVEREKEPQTPLVFNRLLKPGSSSSDIQILKERLSGAGDHSPFYDASLESRIKSLQQDAGLDPDGIIGPSTLDIINASTQSRIDQIDANLERWRWLPRDVPASHIRVNIASFRLRVFEQESPVMEMDVIVGRPYRQTPIFTERLKYMVFNPFWNVPASIIKKDKLTLLKADSQSMAKLGYEASFGNSNQFTSVDQIDWGHIKAGQFSLRQRPGDKNALGKVKFMLPNPHDVYLHDTSDKQLFAKKERLFSSGCIRLSQPRELAEWLLKREKNSAAEKLGDLFSSSQTTTIYLAQPVPVYLVYLTAFLDNNGEVVFRRDSYNRDPAIIAGLNSNHTQQAIENI